MKPILVNPQAPADDLEAVRTICEILSQFDSWDLRCKIMRWVIERAKIDLSRDS